MQMTNFPLFHNAGIPCTSLLYGTLNKVLTEKNSLKYVNLIKSLKFNAVDLCVLKSHLPTPLNLISKVIHLSTAIKLITNSNRSFKSID